MVSTSSSARRPMDRRASAISSVKKAFGSVTLPFTRWSRSPTITKRSRGEYRQTLPGVWPGVWRTRRPPRTGSSSPSTRRYACAPMSRTTWTFARTSISVDARCELRRERVLGDERAPEQVRNAGDEQNDDHLSEADLIETTADRDAGHERDKHRNARDHAERQQIGREEAQRGVGDELHRGRELENRREREDLLTRRQLHRVEN